MTIAGDELGELLGEGAAARVFAARDRSGREVAIKRLRVRDDPEAAARLAREAAVLQGLDHPNLVRLLASGEDDEGHRYLVLERVRGPSLLARIEEHGPLPAPRAWSIVRQVALGLASAHRAGVLHRDVTPANVLLDRTHAKLADFGLARRTRDPRVSRAGATTGTPAYMAPEQFWGADVDERTDVYGLGAVLYTALSGRPPWQGDVADILHSMATAQPPELSPSIPEGVRRFVARALARRPAERPADVEAFLREGDAAFGRRGPLDRAAIAVAMLTVALPIGTGFGGSRSPAAWIREAGPGGWAIVVAALLAAIASGRVRRTAPALAAAPLLAGAVVFFSGLHAVLAGLGRAPAERRFELFHLGWAEASAGWFLGASISAAMLAYAACRGTRLGRLDWRGGVGLAAVAVASLLAAEPGALAIALLAAALLALRAPSRGPDSAVASIAAVLAIGLAVWVRLHGDGARLWIDSDVLRAERASVLLRVAAHERGAIAVALIASAALGHSASWQGVRTWPRARVVVGVGTALTLLAALFGPWWWSRVERARLWAELEPRFALWSQLEPPRAEGEGPARLGPTLQLGRRRIAVDGEAVAPIEAMSTSTGALLIAERLGPRVELGRAPELVVAADRSLAFRSVARALGAARDLGVRHVDLVLVPGRPLSLDRRLPVEAAMVLPRDLRALTLDLAASGERLEIDGDLTYAQALPRLRTRRSIALPH